MENFITSHISEAVTAFAGAFTVWFFQRRKQRTEEQTNEIDNAEKALQYYRQMVDDLGKRLTLAIMELNQSMKMVKDLQIKVEELTEELKKYKQLNGKDENVKKGTS